MSASRTTHYSSHVLKLLAVVMMALVSSTQQQGTVCRYMADLVFVIDASDSMTSKNFISEKNLVRDIVRDFRLNRVDGFMVAALAFSDRVQEVPLYQFKDYNTFVTALYKFNHDKDGTHTYRALHTMRNQFLIFGRNNVPRIGIVITDGRSKNRAETLKQANFAKAAGVTMMSVGVGVDVNVDELTKMASSPNLVFTVLDLVSLRRISYTIAAVVCSSTTPGPSTTTKKTKTTSTKITAKPPVTTSTTKRITPATTRDPSGNPCDNCIYLNGVGFVQHQRCDLYYQCFKKDLTPTYIVMKCGKGQFWDQNSLTCRPPMQVTCPMDPCTKFRLEQYANPDNCATFWKCYNARTKELVCCDKGYGYIAGVSGCNRAPFCKDTCKESTLSTTPPVCDKTSHPTDRTKYIIYIYSMRYIMDCGSGTAFSQATCSCSLHSNTTHTDTCEPEVYLPFNNDTKDKSGNDMWVHPIGTVDVRYVPGSVGGGAAAFNKKNSIMLSRFSNDDFRKKLLIKFRYQEVQHQDHFSGMESLVSNSDCQRDCSIDVSFEKATHSTVAKIKTTVSGVQKVSIVHFGQWKEVEYKYDGSKLTLTVNGIVKSIAVSGTIVPVQAALHIGHGCNSSKPYIGYIDEFYIYKCFP